MTEAAHPVTPPERMPLAEFLEWEAAQRVRHERVGAFWPHAQMVRLLAPGRFHLMSTQISRVT